MIEDPGRRVPLSIDGVFEGDAGIDYRGVVAFIPNRFDKDPATMLAGIIDGQPVRLTHLTRAPDGKVWHARWEVFA